MFKIASLILFFKLYFYILTKNRTVAWVLIAAAVEEVTILSWKRESKFVWSVSISKKVEVLNIFVFKLAIKKKKKKS